MFLFKILTILLLCFSFSFANVKLNVYNKNVKNAQTLMLELKSTQKLTDPKLTMENINIPFFLNKKNSYYALIPISYYEKLGKKRVIISYIKNKKREFKGIEINVINGNYKSERIYVQKSKVQLNEKDKKRTTLEYQEAMRIYRYKSRNKLWSEDFILPMKSKITSDFGTKRVYNNNLKSFHSGIDFKAKIGTPIYAANDGVIKLAKNRFYAGNSVIIDHGQGVYTCYFHLNKMIVKRNETVKKGQLIGYSGKTGRVTGPHLHFATRVHGILVEPKELISLLNNLNKE